MSSLLWIELDGKAPEHNLKELKRNTNGNVLFCAVVKSNAYGHGTAQMVKLLNSADWFAVNSIEEGVELRRMGVKKPVLVLGYVPMRQLSEASSEDLRLTVYNRETIKTLGKINPGKNEVKVHLKIETGTARQGILLDEIPEFVELILSTKGVIFEGISTHYANIEDTINSEYAKKQLDIFNCAVNKVRELGANPPIIHTACTAAAILFPQTHFSMLRVGIGIYGLWPSRETYLSTILGGRRIPDLRPVLSWKTRVVQIKTIPEGSYVGYGCTYRTTRKTRLAILPVGYADGYDRALSNTAHVLINGKRARVIGRVCMNLTMVDITDIPDVKLEDEVVLLGRSDSECITAETMAGWAGTINYEIVTRISPYLERRIV